MASSVSGFAGPSFECFWICLWVSSVQVLGVGVQGFGVWGLGLGAVELRLWGLGFRV